MNRESQAILGSFAQKHHKEATNLKKEGDNALISDVEEAVEASKLVCTSKVSEPKLVSESVEVDRFRLAILGCIRSFVIKESRSCTVGSEGGQVHLKSTGVTVTLPEDALKKKSDILVTSYLPEDCTESPAITSVTTVLPHGLTLTKKATIELKHHLCLEKPFRVRILYYSGLPKCDKGYQLLADLNQETMRAVDCETEFRVERNCIRIICLGFSKYCIIQEGHFYISVRIYAPLAFAEGESEGNVVASLSCQCDEVTKKIDEDQRKLAGEPRECKDFQNDSISVDSTEKVELSVDPPKDSSALYSVDGNSSHTISASALKSFIGQGHMNYITRSFFLIKRTEDFSKHVKINFSYKALEKTGSVDGSSIYPKIWQPMTRTPFSNGRSEPILREVQDKAINAVVSQTAGDRLDEVVSPDERLSVAKRIGRHWRHVGETLGPEPKFTPTELDYFEAKSDYRDRAQAMLTTWTEKHHKNATRRMLVLALKEENQNALISDVFGYDSSSCTAQSSPPSQDSWRTSWCVVL